MNNFNTLSSEFASCCITLATSIITLLYLGWTFKEPGSIDPEDWKRQYIIFFAWLGIAFCCLLVLAIVMGSVMISPSFLLFLFFLVLPVLNGYFTLSYLGIDMEEVKPVDPKDWKRKWIIFFAWLGLVGSSLTVISLFFSYPLILVMGRKNKTKLFRKNVYV